jgi:hypothetical protein
LTGGGSEEERGFSPLLKSLPPLEQAIIRESLINLFERGTKGVRSKTLAYHHLRCYHG